jgi:hypothetical protein
MHGPFPDGKTFAPAIVDSELVVDERFQADLAKVLGDKKILTAQTVYRYEGDGESIVTSPAFVTTLPGAEPKASVQLSWEGVTAKILFTRDLAGYTIRGEAPKLEVASGKGVRMVIAGMHFDMENNISWSERATSVRPTMISPSSACMRARLRSSIER